MDADYKAEYARREAQQEAAAYEAKMRRDEALFRPPVETIPFRDHYGAHEVNGLPAGGQQALLARLDEDGNRTVHWADPDLKRITRLRMLSDRDFPFWDVSYCYGELRDGTTCRVALPFHQLRKRSWKTELVEHARRDGVYAKGLGLFDPDVISTLV